MSDQTPATFRKTKTGKWAVMAPVTTLERALAEKAGVVEVLKKDGGKSTFTVGSLGKPFDVDGQQMCYGYSPEDSQDNTGTSESLSRPARASRSSEWPADSDSSSDAPPSTDFLDREPPRDDSEPMPNFQGESADEWSEGFYG